MRPPIILPRSASPASDGRRLDPMSGPEAAVTHVRRAVAQRNGLSFFDMTTERSVYRHHDVNAGRPM